MAKFPALPLFTDAYLGDTTHLTTIEHGAYLLLLIVAWRSPECRLPNNDKMLARYTKLSPAQWKRIKPIILEFFDVEDGHLIQQRLRDELDTVKRLTMQRSNAGKASALKRHNRDQRALQREGNENIAPTPTPTPTPSDKEDIDKSISPKSDIQEAFDLYCRMATKYNLPVPSKLTAARKSKLTARLKDAGGIKGWTDALIKVCKSGHCLGDNDRNWKANLDFLLKESSFTKLMEGNYDNRDPNGGTGHGGGNQPNDKGVVGAAARALAANAQSGLFGTDVDHGNGGDAGAREDFSDPSFGEIIDHDAPPGTGDTFGGTQCPDDTVGEIPN